MKLTDSFADAQETHTEPTRFFIRIGSHALPLIADLQLDNTVLPAQHDFGHSASGMSMHIQEALLRHPKQCRFDIVPQSSQIFIDTDRYPQAAALAETLSVVYQRGTESNFIK